MPARGPEQPLRRDVFGSSLGRGYLTVTSQP